MTPLTIVIISLLSVTDPDFNPDDEPAELSWHLTPEVKRLRRTSSFSRCLCKTNCSKSICSCRTKSRACGPLCGCTLNMCKNPEVCAQNIIGHVVVNIKSYLLIIFQINQWPCSTLDRVLNSQSDYDWVLYKHYWEFPFQKKLIPMLTCSFCCRHDLAKTAKNWCSLILICL